MSVTIYRNNISIIIPEATVGSWDIGILQAVGNGDGTVSIANRGKEDPDGGTFYELAGFDYDDIFDDNGNTYGASETEVVNALNALFTDNGVTLPTITSSTSVSVSSGAPVNYQVTGEGIVGVSWSGLPTGLEPSSFDRKLVQGTTSVLGATVATLKVFNATGVTTTSVTFNVTSSFADTKSVRFDNNDYMSIPVAGGSMFSRAGNGAGASDAWSISLWFKPGSSNSSNQTLLYFGGDDANNKGGVWLLYRGSSGEQRIRLQYGSNNNNLQMTSPTGSVPKGSWSHILITYDGGTTGASSGSLSGYYSRFKILIDGALVTKSNSNSNFGWSAAMPSDLFRVGRRTSGNYIRSQGKINELAVWDSDQSANVTAIYNGGVPHDLSLLAVTPDGWWRMGDGDTFPTIDDNIGSSDGTLNNMTSADIVSDTP